MLGKKKNHNTAFLPIKSTCDLRQVLPVETGVGGPDAVGVAGLVHLAPGDLPALVLHLPAGVQLRSHVQHHVGAGATHLLLFRLRRPQLLQPG